MHYLVKVGALTPIVNTHIYEGFLYFIIKKFLLPKRWS